jgi:hypothetical protein
VRHACGARHTGGTARFYNGGMIMIDPKGPSLPYASRLPKLEYFLLSVKHPDVGHGEDGQIVKWLVENRLTSTLHAASSTASSTTVCRHAGRTATG